MLEIKNLNKTYYPKKGVPINALKNINLSFEETGMVFILGKSGSGKSTFLNLVGGLDSVSGGEFIIKGRSSKDFKSADFDSYRNTFIGFVFQEYNILNEFSVGKNVALAFELQGKKAEEQIIKDTLSKVDLDGYESRKPSELSVGQKQRVAIARALVKDPQIILADEPTGSLDSATGKQIFELLKRLSKDKLVIVVSHDLEYAAAYADRVIEFLDGEIISDKAKQADYSSVSVSHATTNNTTTNAANSAITTAANVDITTKTSNQTTATNKQNKITTTFKKSRLPLKHAAKMGLNSLISKPIRLIFTILLSFIAFGLFGISDALASYNKYDATYNSMKNSGIYDINLTKFERLIDGEIINDYYSTMTANDIKKLSSNFPAYRFDALYNIEYLRYSYLLFEHPTSFYYKCNDLEFNGIIETNNNHFDGRFSLMGANSRYPEKTDEIMIPYCVFEVFRDFGIIDITNGEKIEINEVEDLIGKTIAVQRNLFGELLDLRMKIVGVLDTQFPSKRFEILKEPIYDMDFTTLEQKSAYDELFSLSRNSYHFAMYTSGGFIKEYFPDSYYRFGDQSPVLDADVPHTFTQAYPIDYLKSNEIYYIKENKTALTKDEITVSPYVLACLLSEDYSEIHDSDMIQNRLSDKILSLYDNEMQQKLINLFDTEPSLAALAGYTDWSVPPDINHFYALVYAEAKGHYLDFSLDFSKMKDLVVIDYLLEKASESLDFNLKSDSGDITVNIAGVYLTYNDWGYIKYGMLVANQSFLDANFVFDNIPIKSALTRLKLNKKQDMRLIKYSYKTHEQTIDGESVIGYRMNNAVYDLLEKINPKLETLASTVLYVGIGIAVFASLLFMSFISASINHKKREIGILRAIGARSIDVFKIFFIESLIIAIISFIFASVAAGIGCYFINYFLWKEMEFIITLFTFSIRQVVIIFVISIGVAVLSSFVPVYRTARKKPVDAIRTV